jgi:endo-1,4-beta-xylanase
MPQKVVIRTNLPQLFTAGFLALGMLNCSGSDATTGGPSSAGATGTVATGGESAVGRTSTTSASDGGTATGGNPATGGAAPAGGKSATGGNASGGAATGGNASGGAVAGGKSATGGNASGGKSATGGAAAGGKPATGGSATGGAATSASATGGRAAGGKSATGGAGLGGSASGTGGLSNVTAAAGSGANGTSTTDTVDCNATMPTGGKTYTGTNVNGVANGLNYGIWTNGSGGSVTVFTDAHAFAASWDNSQDFLAHLGLDFNGTKSYTAYGTILAQFVEVKSGTAGGFSMIGMYGWMHNPCIEWYINEDSYNGLSGRGNVTATIDGATYYLSTLTTTGTGGANACESGHTGSWTQMISTRQKGRQCGTITVSDHFAAWAKQGWTLGNLTSVHINVEVGGGKGSVEFPVANVTTSSK